MAGRLSRRKIAAYVANELVSGADTKATLRKVAAYLVETGRTREYELLVRDIEEALLARGIVVARVTSAHPLSDTIKRDIQALAGAKTLQLRETIDEKVLGGVRVDLPGRRFDGTLRRKLNALRAKQV